MNVAPAGQNISNNADNCSCPENILDTWSSRLEDILIPSIGSLGLIGNLAAIFVLKRPELKSTFHQSLLTLALCDIILLVFILGDMVVDVNSVYYIYMFPYFWNPVKNIIMSWETFLIMSIATERFLAVCLPVIYRRHKLRHSSFTHLLTFVLPGLLLAMLLNITKFLEVELVTRPFDNNNGPAIDYQATSMRLDPDYIYYYIHWHL